MRHRLCEVIEHTQSDYILGKKRVQSPTPLKTALDICMGACESAGITRLSDLTLLDSILIPTWQAVRPLSRNMVVSQGKGVSRELAMISALAESLELSCAELPCWDNWISPTNMESALPYKLQDLPGFNAAPIDLMGVPRKWTAAIELTTQSWTYIPTELVTLDFAAPIGDPPMFTATSNGLASGCTPTEAILHGMLEVIERDAIAHAERGWIKPLEVDIESITSLKINQFLSNIELSGSTIKLHYIESRIGTPTFEASITHPNFGTFSGTAAHLNPDTAVVRAITEAAQSRITAISGARDDITNRTYASHNRGFMPTGSIYRKPHKQRKINLNRIPNHSEGNLTADFDKCVSLLRTANQLCLVADIGSLYTGLFVGFVVAPGMLRTHGHG